MDIISLFLKEETIRLSEDSADSQIDSVLLKYQDESSLEEEDVDSINEFYKMPDNWSLLLEDEQGQNKEPEGSDEKMSVGDDIQRSTEPVNPRSQKINIDDFAQKIANLYEHYDNLLNIKTVIINRAINLLERGYSSDVIDEFLTILEREFGITPEGDVEEDIPLPPTGGSAGPIGA